MNKLNGTDPSSNPMDIGNLGKATEDNVEIEEGKEGPKMDTGLETTELKNTKTENEDQDVLKFTMLFNKYNSVLDVKRRNDETKRDNKYSMFFNKEVTIRRSLETPSPAAQLLEAKKSALFSPRRTQPLRSLRNKSKSQPNNRAAAEPELSEPGMMFYTSLFHSLPDVWEKKTQPEKKFLNKRNSRVEDSLVQLNVHPATQKELRNHNSLTNLQKNKANVKGDLNSKIPSLTALDVNSGQQKAGFSRLGYWDHWDDLILMQSDVEKRLNLQISRSSNDNNRRSGLKFKKEDAASVSDSKLLYTDSESKKHIKKCDKKSRGDSSRKERSCSSRKQVQWKTEVDVIYFSSHMAANGDRMGEVIGRVMEPLREEWEQQRKGFYAKLVPSHMENHIKDHFISLLKI